MNSNLCSSTPTRRRFRVISILTAVAYCLAVAVISGSFGWHPPRAGIGLYAAAILPALPIGFMLYAMARCLATEPDEFYRAIQVQTMLAGLGVTLVVCTAWGFLAQYAHVWVLPLYFVFPLWVASMAICAPLVHLRYR